MKTLAKEHPLLSCNNIGTAPVPNWEIANFAPGWRVLSPGPSGVFVSDTFFDLAGLTQREKTLFFEAATVQTMGNPIVFTVGPLAPGPGDALNVIDLMTTKSLTDTELINFTVYGNFASAGGALTPEETVYARINQFVVDLDTAAWGSMIQAASHQIGSLKPTASDRIYSYRIVVAGTPFQGGRFDLYAARHLINADVKEEAEYRYLMRLRRSYELQQSHDED